MIRIIEEKPDPSVVKQVLCHNCGVKLEYVPHDIQKRKVSDYTGGCDTYHYITCPKCSEEIPVSR